MKIKGITDQGIRRLAKFCKKSQEAETPTIHLDNMDREDAMVTVHVEGEGVATWALEVEQSIMGSTWEADGPDFAYAIISDQVRLVEALEADGYIVDDSEYYAHTEEEFEEMYQKYLESGGM